ncbi:MAG TPA: hypothetical protein VJ464_26460 [Blastocatellia bacterium]|nr:hypothetical protein [Blastocatellia bacterium]
MSEFISSYFGRWIWYSQRQCVYEQLRFSVYSLNLVMIVALICVLAWGLRRQFRRGIVPEARQIIPWLGVALFGWMLQYASDLSTFHPTSECYFDEKSKLAIYGIPVFSGLASVGFFFAGSYLLQLEGRFHSSLRGPTDRGIDLKTLRRILGNRFARAFYILFALISLCLQWTLSEPLPWGPDILGNCVAHMTFGLGLLRELNRERREFVGLASAVSMLFYGAVQLTAYREELFFDGYILAILLKFALILTMFSFGTMVKNAAIARQEERRDVTDLLIALSSTLRHDLRQPLTSLDLNVARLSYALHAPSDELLSPTRKAIKYARDYFNHWPERLKATPLILNDFFKERQFKLNKASENDPYIAWVPPLFLEWAVDRLRENGEAAEAPDIYIDLKEGHNEGNESAVIVRMINNGPPIPPNIMLFKKPNGTWVARYLMQLAGGNLELESSNKDGTVFRIELPANAPASAEAIAATE